MPKLFTVLTTIPWYDRGDLSAHAEEPLHIEVDLCAELTPLVAGGEKLDVCPVMAALHFNAN